MNLLILGAGGHGRNCLEIAESTGKYEKIAFLDDGENTTVYGYPVIGKLAEYEFLKDSYSHAFVAIGNNELRKYWIEKLEDIGFNIPVLISPEAVVSSRAKVEIGSVIFPFAHVQSGAVVSKGSVLSTGTVVGHDSTVGEFSLIYENCVVRPGSTVNKGTILKAGSVVEKINKAVVNCSEEWVRKYRDAHNGEEPSFF